MYTKSKHNNRRRDYTGILLRQKETVFHTQDLAQLWGITQNNTLRMTISRYLARGILFPLQRGMYSTVSPEALNPQLLALKTLHRFGYVSCEQVLFTHGILSQPPQTITLMSSISKQFSVLGLSIRIRKLQDTFLYHPYGVAAVSGILTASIDRAICDMLYINSVCHFDAPVDFDHIRKVQRTIGYPLTTRT